MNSIVKFCIPASVVGIIVIGWVTGKTPLPQPLIPSSSIIANDVKENSSILTALLAFPADSEDRRQAINHGEAIFYDAACWKCHSLGETEFPGNPDFDNAGPDLSDISKRLNPANILNSIQNPSAVIADPIADHVDEFGLSKMPSFAEALPEIDQIHLTWFLSEWKESKEPVSDISIVTDENFETEVLQSEHLVLLDFWAEWCLPCLELNPVLESIAPDYRDRVKICKIEVDSNPESVTEYVPDNIFPCLVLMKEGKVIDRKYGTTPGIPAKDFLNNWFNLYLQ